MNRKEKIQSIRQALDRGNASIGSWIQIPHPSIAEIMGRSGYDWVAVDMEHGTVGAHQLPDLFRALELGGTLPLVRLAHGATKDCKRALDAGAGGVIVPMVESAQQLAGVRDACRWPPSGTRGVGFSRANLFGADFAAYAEEAQAPLLVAMIEHIRAVDSLEEILAVDGLDAILIGPYDLSASMGVTGQFDAPGFLTAMERIRSACRVAGKPCGLHVVAPDAAELTSKLDEGYRFLAYSIDSVFLRMSAMNPVESR
ncbi:2,4-dihydroxyhept-2-ene-1,7-dioic acid aldolase [Nitrogeniibacter mangrovi]|uniref:2,4-dihydroxyhept-2-ene-1,7-dioic acid aldolase n=1 Tax=Nitrogeniibacter mangrovi TaxID=2016596 RepID=A0A6C1B091_9RHOO|nr:aldolase/citrate lyase family protein [Nitrogeniibacter mangrovi]QID16987.1 2,4-dihydroxyhept-2-ene-1,7-dioic acid aldolase [Nitrogeniibacter mangrovi]